MGVDYTIGIGYGYRLREEDILDPDEVGVSEILETLYSKYPRLTYITGGSYYDSTPIEHAIVFRSTHQDMDDFAGFMQFEKPKLTADDLLQMRDATRELTGHRYLYVFDANMSWHVAGLWH